MPRRPRVPRVHGGTAAPDTAVSHAAVAPDAVAAPGAAVAPGAAIAPGAAAPGAAAASGAAAVPGAVVAPSAVAAPAAAVAPVAAGDNPKNTSFAAPEAVGNALSDLAAIRGAEFEVLEAHAHAKKLPRGALAGNRFTIRIRDIDAPDALLAERLAAIARDGVPNYFGPQRFGRSGANLRKINRDPDAIHPRERTYVLSAARSLIFNAVLAERVTESTWRQLESGDVANLDARGSVFPVEAVDASLRERAERLDIHPTGPLWGGDEPMTAGRICALEERVAAEFEDACALVIAAGMRQERRSLRLAVRQLDWTREGADLVVRFWLTKGSFATTVLRELIETGEEEEGA
jgi:tRNA pseudouridine13 synthase